MALSADDTKRIIKHFLLSSPPGEFQDVLTDVRSLVNDDALLNEVLHSVFHTYNIEQLTPIAVPDQKYKILLCKYGEVDNSHYVDPISNQICTVDHVKQVITEVRPGSDDQNREKRAALQSTIDNYVADHYLDGTATVFSQGDDLIICISATKHSPNNFWGGRWRSVYKVSFQSETKVKLSGSMKVNMHYYENGNVQLNTSHEHGETIDGQSVKDLADKVAKSLEKAENSFENQIEQACNTMSDSVFKSLRRRLPVTQQLIDFTSVAHAVVQEYAKKH